MDLIMLIAVAWYALVRFGVSVMNSFFPSFLPHHTETKDLPSLSLCIPIRNEESRLASFFHDLTNSGFSGPVLFCDDNSTDSSLQILQEFAKNRPNVHLYSSPPLPALHFGKPMACATLSPHITTQYALFMDVDVRIKPQAFRDLIDAASNDQSDLLSVFPFQRFRFLGEELVVPLMFHLLLSHLPLRWITHQKWWRFAAANGQVLLFRTEFLQKHHLWNKVTSEIIEDIKVAQWTKRLGGKTTLYFSDPRISTFMYQGSAEARQGFSKNITHLLGGYFGAFAHLTTALIFPIALCFSHFWWWNIVFFVLGWISFMINLNRKTALVPFQSWVYYPFYLIHFYRTLFFSLWNTTRKTNTWKNRIMPG
jgi:glycosyltransferase involved in cell wall biosynthesis